MPFGELSGSWKQHTPHSPRSTQEGAAPISRTIQRLPGLSGAQGKICGCGLRDTLPCWLHHLAFPTAMDVFVANREAAWNPKEAGAGNHSAES